MAKVVKSTREVMDVDQELSKIKSSKVEVDKKVPEKSTKKEKHDTKKEKKPRKGLIGFFKGVFKELSKVKWPTRKDMLKYSIATISFILFFSILFYVVQLLVALAKTWV